MVKKVFLRFHFDETRIFLADFLPQIYIFWTRSLIILCRLQNLGRSFFLTVAMYKGQFEIFQIIFPFYTFSSFIIFVDY